MRVLATWGSKRGGTEGIARILAEALRGEGLDVELLASSAASKATAFDAAIVGGAIYANRWHPAARRFVNRQQKRLRGVPVWFFSSGPLDDSAAGTAIGAVQHSLAMFGSLAGTWLPLLLIFLATWTTGEVMGMRPQQPSHE